MQANSETSKCIKYIDVSQEKCFMKLHYSILITCEIETFLILLLFTFWMCRRVTSQVQRILLHSYWQLHFTSISRERNKLYLQSSRTSHRHAPKFRHIFCLVSRVVRSVCVMHADDRVKLVCITTPRLIATCYSLLSTCWSSVCKVHLK